MGIYLVSDDGMNLDIRMLLPEDMHLSLGVRCTHELMICMGKTKLNLYIVITDNPP